MATPLEDLDRILQSINATEAQRCFLRNYVLREGLTDIRHLGPRTSVQVHNVYPHGLSGHVITGTIDGRHVQIIVGDQSNVLVHDQVHIQARQANGKLEVYNTYRFRDRTHTSLYQDAEIANIRERTGLWDWGHSSVIVGGMEQRFETGGFYRLRPPNDRHRQLNSYHACAPIARNDGPSRRLEPIV